MISIYAIAGLAIIRSAPLQYPLPTSRMASRPFAGNPSDKFSHPRTLVQNVLHHETVVISDANFAEYAIIGV